MDNQSNVSVLFINRYLTLSSGVLESLGCFSSNYICISQANILEQIADRPFVTCNIVDTFVTILVVQTLYVSYQWAMYGNRIKNN